MADQLPPLTISKSPFAGTEGLATKRSTDDLPAAKQQFDQTMGGLSAQLAGVDARAKADMDRIDAQRGSLKLPPMEPLPPPPPVKMTDPVQQWGSIAMIAAGLGSLLTRSHATTALNAAAEVMKGFHQGDMEKANAEFQRWKVANDNTMRIMNYQLQAYRAAMSDIDRREGLSLRESSLAERAIVSQMAATGRAYGDAITAARAETGDLNGVIHRLADLENIHAKMQKATDAAELHKQYMDASAELMQSEGWKAADPIQRLNMMTQLQKGKFKGYDTRGDGDPNDVKLAKQVYAWQFGNGFGGFKTGSPDPDKWYREQWPTWSVGSRATEPKADIKKRLDEQSVPAKVVGQPAQPPAAQPPAAAQPQQTAPGTTATFKDGHQLRFMGGDSHDPNNWQPVANSQGSNTGPPIPRSE